jgi:hypothetical protein
VGSAGRRVVSPRARPWCALGVGAAFGAVTLAAGTAHASPRIAAFECRIGEGRGVLPSRAEEGDSDDELICRVTLAGLGGRSPSDLVAELQIVPRAGPFRVVASTEFEPVDSAGERAQIREMVVPHGTWSDTVDWSAPPSRRSATRTAATVHHPSRHTRSSRPGLRLVLCVRDRPPPGQTSWRLIARKRLDIPRTAGPLPRTKLERLFRWVTAR